LGVWVLGFGVGGIAPTPQPPIPNPQSPILELIYNAFKNN